MIGDDEYARLLNAIRDPAFYDLVVTTWETGCRPQESLRLEARHVDVTNQRWVFPKSESKNKQLSRVVYLTDTALTISRALVTTYPSGPLFRNSRGDGWTNYAVQCAFRRVKARIGKATMKEQGIVVSDSEIDNLVITLAVRHKSAGQLIDKRPSELRAEAKRKIIERRAVELAPATRSMPCGIPGRPGHCSRGSTR